MYYCLLFDPDLSLIMGGGSLDYRDAPRKVPSTHTYITQCMDEWMDR